MKQLPRTLVERTLRTRVEVRFGDLDLNGHVNHAAYLSYAETARVRHLDRTLLAPGRAIAAGFAVVVLRLEIDYRAELGFEDVVVATSRYRFKGIGKSFRNSGTVLTGGVLAAQLDVVLGVLDLRTRRLRTNPVELLGSEELDEDGRDDV